MSWLVDARREVADRGLDRSWLGVLHAFGGDEVADDPPADLPAAIALALNGEVDGDQATLFARRFDQVATLLEGVSGPEAALLLVFLRHRAVQVLLGPSPRALRVRALVDFVFGYAARLVHHAPDAPPLAEHVRRARWTEVSRGVQVTTLDGVTPDGPIHVNLLRVRGRRLHAVDARPGADLVTLANTRGAVAAVSGGFFLYSEPDIAAPSRRTDPVGLLVCDGRVLGPPVFRRSALVQRDDGRTEICRIGAADAEIDGAPLEGPFFNRAYGAHAPDDGSLRAAIVGDVVVDVGRGAMPIPLSGLVIPWRGGLRIGDRVQWTVPGVRDAMAGGPTLIGPDARSLAAEEFAGTAPPVTFSQDETFDANLLPRMVVGTWEDGELLFAAIDGRNLDRAPGFTLGGAAGLLSMFGCVRAANLDGGSSKRMVVAGVQRDLPSTDFVAGQASDRVRPVYSAILIGP